MSLLDKKIADLTDAEKSQLYKPIGTSDLPYPATHFILNSSGELEMDLGKIDKDDSAIPIYSDRDYAFVVGTMYRDMAVPSLLYMQKESLLRRALDSKNRLSVVLGDPGVGKSHLAKMLARIRDSRGGWVMDCGGRYMSDLLFEQVIDFGEDFKSALTTRIKSGALSNPSIALLDEQAPGSLLRDSSGKVTGINWDKVAAPKVKDKRGTLETSKEAVDRSVAIMESVAKYESIPMSAVNALGIKKQPGILIRAYQEGREVLLDEYNKSIEGSDDSLQTVLQFFAGEIDEVTVENTMKVNGREETYSFTFRRADMKPGFFITMTGNKEHDGVSTHALSRSAYSRVSPFVIEAPVAADWRHRVSQILTGLPLTTIYSMFSEQAAADPNDFGRQMVELRLMGLSLEEKAAVPS
ncbi:MAG TPA: ATP-binding protein, partial [Alphaproteobacteria bacterium]